MKELTIQIKVDGTHIATLINKEGFDDSISSQNEIVGLLYNLLSSEQSKLKTILSTTTPKGNNNLDL